MRRLLLALLLSLPVPALAAEEVQGLRVESQGAAGADARELAVAKATRQAAEAVWKNAGRDTPLPELSPIQLQTITTYVDVTNETVQSNYYAGTFNVGINKAALMRIAGGNAPPAPANDDNAYSVAGPATPGPVRGVSNSYSTAPAPTAAPAPTTAAKPDWVLIVPAHETAEATAIWNSNDLWTAAWMKAPPTPGLFMAPAGGDTKDRVILSAETLRAEAVEKPVDALLALARKYSAPAVVLVTMRTPKNTVQVGDEVGIMVEYYAHSEAAAETAETNLFVTASNMPTIADEAVKETQRLVLQLVNNGEGSAVAAAPTPAPVAYSGTPAAQTPNSATVTAAPVMGGSWQKLWVRMPVKSPADIANYRKQVESIPNTRLEIISLTREFMEANIVYNGSQATLLEALSFRGLRAKN